MKNIDYNSDLKGRNFRITRSLDSKTGKIISVENNSIFNTSDTYNIKTNIGTMYIYKSELKKLIKNYVADVFVGDFDFEIKLIGYPKKK